MHEGQLIMPIECIANWDHTAVCECGGVESFSQFYYMEQE